MGGVQFDAIAFLYFPSLAESRFPSPALISLSFSPPFRNQPIRCPAHLLILSRGNLSRLFFFPRVTEKLYPFALSPSLSLSLYLTFSLHPLSTHPRVGKIAVSIFSPSELYTRYIMNIVISRRSYTVRSFLKWKSTGKVGRGLRVTFRLLDPPAPESSYRLSRLSSTSSIALATYFTFSIAFLFSPFLPPSPFQVACIIN